MELKFVHFHTVVKIGSKLETYFLMTRQGIDCKATLELNNFIRITWKDDHIIVPMTNVASFKFKEGSNFEKPKPATKSTKSSRPAKTK